MRLPPSEMAQLMGKCAYTALILYKYPLVTPLNRLVMWEQTVLTAASCFFLPNHFSTLIVFLTVTARAFTEASRPSGTVISWKELISFMFGPSLSKVRLARDPAKNQTRASCRSESSNTK